MHATGTDHAHSRHAAGTQQARSRHASPHMYHGHVRAHTITHRHTAQKEKSSTAIMCCVRPLISFSLYRLLSFLKFDTVGFFNFFFLTSTKTKNRMGFVGSPPVRVRVGVRGYCEHFRTYLLVAHRSASSRMSFSTIPTLSW